MFMVVMVMTVDGEFPYFQRVGKMKGLIMSNFGKTPMPSLRHCSNDFAWNIANIFLLLWSEILKRRPSVKNDQELQRSCFAVYAPFVVKTDVVTSVTNKENTTMSVAQYMTRTNATKSFRNFMTRRNTTKSFRNFAERRWYNFRSKQ